MPGAFCGGSGGAGDGSRTGWGGSSGSGSNSTSRRSVPMSPMTHPLRLPLSLPWHRHAVQPCPGSRGAAA